VTGQHFGYFFGLMLLPGAFLYSRNLFVAVPIGVAIALVVTAGPLLTATPPSLPLEDGRREPRKHCCAAARRCALRDDRLTGHSNFAPTEEECSGDSVAAPRGPDAHVFALPETEADQPRSHSEHRVILLERERSQNRTLLRDHPVSGCGSWWWEGCDDEEDVDCSPRDNVDFIPSPDW
jgi:hypothetical protein